MKKKIDDEYRHITFMIKKENFQETSQPGILQTKYIRNIFNDFNLGNLSITNNTKKRKRKRQRDSGREEE